MRNRNAVSDDVVIPVGFDRAGRAAPAHTAQVGGGVRPTAAIAAGARNERLSGGTGDRVKVAVFGKNDLSGTFAVSAEQTISLPLIGEVRVGGMSLREVEKAIVVRLKDGYLKEPQVSAEVVNYRPFYILGEVHRPGSYRYVGNMTVLNAVALGGGYTHRAKKGRVYMTRSDEPQQRERLVKTNEIVQPGDVLRVPERFF